jgi:hypothetical protein
MGFEPTLIQERRVGAGTNDEEGGKDWFNLHRNFASDCKESQKEMIDDQSGKLHFGVNGAVKPLSKRSNRAFTGKYTCM